MPVGAGPGTGVSPRPVVFWWVTPSIHMEPCLEALPSHWRADMRAVWCNPLPPGRAALGWRLPRTGAMSQESLPESRSEAARRIRDIVREHPGAIHVYSGWTGQPRVHAAFRGATTDPTARHVVVAEAFRGWGVRRYVRHVRAFCQTLPYRGCLDAVLAMGDAGVRFYRQLGLDRRKVLPFMYQSPAAGAALAARRAGPLRLVYVGRFDPRKGVQDLIEALAPHASRSWTLTVYGDGPRRAALEALARRRGLASQIRWAGAVSHDALMREFPTSDVAIVPSRFDGWGVATNEALQAGLGVVVSDRTASCDLVRYSGAGRIFRAGRPRSLAAVLGVLLDDPAQVSGWHSAASRYAPRIGGDAVARYLSEVFRWLDAGPAAPSPMAPWTVRDLTAPASARLAQPGS